MIQIRKTIFILFLFFISKRSDGQYTIRIEILSLPSAHSNDSIFVAGNFNSWNPGKAGYLFSKENDKQIIEIKGLTADVYEFKFTRGDWGRVETTADGKDVQNKSVKLSSDTILQYTIGGWKDDFAVAPRTHTASRHVSVIDTAFFIPQLNRTRRIWVYLPEGYNKSKTRYPVMYMHDGQNLFDEYTSGFGEWGVDECLDSLIAKGKPPCIVIGIDNGGGVRMNEYSPYDFTYERNSNHSLSVVAEGRQYTEFLVKTLKPFIDKKYRTLPSKDNTIIAGSSMGGLISFYAMLAYPDVFGKGGIFSPSFWIAPSMKQVTDSLAGKIDSKFFFYAGEMESGSMVEDMEKIEEVLGERSSSIIYSVTDPDGKHNEQAWRKWFADFYNWTMASGFNNVIRVND